MSTQPPWPSWSSPLSSSAQPDPVSRVISFCLLVSFASFLLNTHLEEIVFSNKNAYVACYCDSKLMINVLNATSYADGAVKPLMVNKLATFVKLENKIINACHINRAIPY